MMREIALRPTMGNRPSWAQGVYGDDVIDIDVRAEYPNLFAPVATNTHPVDVRDENEGRGWSDGDRDKRYRSQSWK